MSCSGRGCHFHGSQLTTRGRKEVVKSGEGGIFIVSYFFTEQWQKACTDRDGNEESWLSKKGPLGIQALAGFYFQLLEAFSTVSLRFLDRRLFFVLWFR